MFNLKLQHFFLQFYHSFRIFSKNNVRRFREYPTISLPHPDAGYARLHIHRYEIRCLSDCLTPAFISLCFLSSLQVFLLTLQQAEALLSILAGNEGGEKCKTFGHLSLFLYHAPTTYNMLQFSLWGNIPTVSSYTVVRTCTFFIPLNMIYKFVDTSVI
jgi:hypothetical protein